MQYRYTEKPVTFERRHEADYDVPTQPLDYVALDEDSLIGKPVIGTKASAVILAAIALLIAGVLVGVGYLFWIIIERALIYTP